MTTSTADPRVRATVFSSATDNWPTPQVFFDALHTEFGFALDACASSENRKTDAYYGLDHRSPSRRDGLTGDWAADAVRNGGAVWMNPPYGRGIGTWMAKAAATAAAGVTVVCLVPARTDTAWFHDHVLAHGAEVRFVRGRLRFGQATNSAPFANLVVIYRAGSPASVEGNPPAVLSREPAAARPRRGGSSRRPATRREPSRGPGRSRVNVQEPVDSVRPPRHRAKQGSNICSSTEYVQDASSPSVSGDERTRHARR